MKVRTREYIGFAIAIAMVWVVVILVNVIYYRVKS